ncbi:MAG: hypothetical protein J5748_07170 [Bacteroidales bacterium]|nr:hypothetical protein [Bacteroidales bacterium]
MKRLAIIILLLACSVAALAQTKFFTGSGLGYVFDNHEFAPSGGQYIPSETIHFVRVSNVFGWEFPQSDNVSHKVVFGVDMVKQMGTEVEALKDIVADVPIYYQASSDDGEKAFCAAVGSFPRRFVRGAYSEALMSEETMETDFNLDGMYLSYGKGAFFTELALDWMGKYGNTRKERFQILSYGAWDVAGVFSFGWAGSFYHYAGSVAAPGVVDNHHLQVFGKVALAPLGDDSELSLKLSGIASYQRDRLRDDLRLPYGGEAEALFRWKSLGVRNVTAYTGDMVPFYRDLDSAGNMYGDMLYRGSKFYKGFYDLAELYWMPRITKKLDLKVSFRFHYGAAGFLGSEQRVALVFDI